MTIMGGGFGSRFSLSALDQRTCPKMEGMLLANYQESL